MANGSIVTNNGAIVMLNRTYKASPDYLAPTVFKVGISNSTPDVTDTDLDVVIPISDGTVVDNGSNQLTGSNGGANTTDNTSRFKEGAGESDAKGQNLVTDGLGANATKTWTLNPLTANFSSTEPFGFWLYIDDAADYAKLIAAGTAIQVRIRTNGDPANQHYLYNRTKAQLAVGWNWVTSGLTDVGSLSTGAGGAPSGNLDEFIIEVTTANATDEFNVAVAGELVYDLMRRWADSDLIKNYVASYPTIDETNLEVETRGKLASTEANGFDVDGYAEENEDATPKMVVEDTITSESKASTDEFIFVGINRLIL